MSRGPDAAALLDRALVQAARAAGCDIEIERADWTRWASATFTGARHVIGLRAAGSAALDAWLSGIGEHEFALPRHVVADIVVTSAYREGDVTRVQIEALTVESH